MIPLGDPDSPKNSPSTESYILFSLLTFISNSSGLITEWLISYQSPYTLKEANTKITTGWNGIVSLLNLHPRKVKIWRLQIPPWKRLQSRCRFHQELVHLDTSFLCRLQCHTQAKEMGKNSSDQKRKTSAARWSQKVTFVDYAYKCVICIISKAIFVRIHYHKGCCSSV